MSSCKYYTSTFVTVYYHFLTRFNASALDSILLSVLSALEAELVFIRNLVGGLLAELEDDIDRDRFKRLLHYSRRLASFQNRAKLVRRCFLIHLCQANDASVDRFKRPSKKSLNKVCL